MRVLSLFCNTWLVVEHEEFTLRSVCLQFLLMQFLSYVKIYEFELFLVYNI